RQCPGARRGRPVRPRVPAFVELRPAGQHGRRRLRLGGTARAAARGARDLLMPPTAPVPSRALGQTAATALVVGQVIAVGIFLTPGTIIRTVASPVWVVAVWAV